MTSKSNSLSDQAEELVKAGKLSEAVTNYSQLLELLPNEALRWLCARGQCYLKMNEAKLALEDGKAALTRNPNCVDACILSGKASIQLGKFTNALEFYQCGLRVEVNNQVIVSELKKLQTLIMQDQKQDEATAEGAYSAVSLCSQSVYPGDDQLLINEKEILEVKYKILDDEFYSMNQNWDKRDAEMEGRLVQAAYECLTSNRLEESLALISKVLALDPGNVFYRTFRAQVHFNLKQWVKVVQDYWVIPKPQRKPDVWKQGGKALMELWLPVLAEFWLRKATQLSGGKDEEAAILFQKVRVRRLYDPLTVDQPVLVDFSEYGRAVFAKEDIAKGETVMTDIPLVTAQSIGSRDVPACFNCAVSLITPEIYFNDKMAMMDGDLLSLIEEFWPDVSPVWCPHCDQEMYCSQICRSQAWDVYHCILCPHVNPGAAQLYELVKNNGSGYTSDGQWANKWTGHFSPMILAKIWAMIVSQVKSLMEKDGTAQPSVEQWARAKAPFRRFIAFGTTPAIQRMPHMLPVFQSVFADCGNGISYKITADEFNGRYYQAACNLQSFSPLVTPYHRFMDNIKEDMRALNMVKFLVDRPPEAQFAALCPLHACTNHSCYNNAEVHDFDINGRPAVQMIARRDIKKGEEISITYIDTTLPKVLRKAWLFRSFNFWCQCKRCQFEGELPEECTNCHKKAPEGKKFGACGKCKRAWYCGVACQKDAWKKGHKIICLAGHSQVVYPERQT